MVKKRIGRKTRLHFAAVYFRRPHRWRSRRPFHPEEAKDAEVGGLSAFLRSGQGGPTQHGFQRTLIGRMSVTPEASKSRPTIAAAGSRRRDGFWECAERQQANSAKESRLKEIFAMSRAKNRQRIKVCHGYHNGKDRLPGFAVCSREGPGWKDYPRFGEYAFSLHPTIHIDGRGLYFSLKAD